LTLDLDDRRVDAAADGYDAVVRNGPIADSRLMAWRLAPSRRVLVASPAYLRDNGKPASIEDLEQHRGIFYTNRGAADWRFRTTQGPVAIQAKQAFGVNNGDMIRDAVIAGLGLAMLPAFIASPAIKAGTLINVPLDLVADEEWIYMAHAQGRDPSTKLRALRDHLKEAFGDPPYWDAP
jgi:DNA-binding transcriptional LysR family regulator